MLHVSGFFLFVNPSSDTSIKSKGQIRHLYIDTSLPKWSFFYRGHPVVLILTIAYIYIYIIQPSNTIANIYLIKNEWATSFGH